uniref:Uncharacterized protein n=1 Tax=Parascaris univalens TaxID=6257 RepID=A0A915CK03_PARUN
MGDRKLASGGMVRRNLVAVEDREKEIVQVGNGGRKLGNVGDGEKETGGKWRDAGEGTVAQVGMGDWVRQEIVHVGDWKNGSWASGQALGAWREELVPSGGKKEVGQKYDVGDGEKGSWVSAGIGEKEVVQVGGWEKELGKCVGDGEKEVVQSRASEKEVGKGDGLGVEVEGIGIWFRVVFRVKNVVSGGGV